MYLPAILKDKVAEFVTYVSKPGLIWGFKMVLVKWIAPVIIPPVLNQIFPTVVRGVVHMLMWANPAVGASYNVVKGVTGLLKHQFDPLEMLIQKLSMRISVGTNFISEPPISCDMRKAC